MRILSRALGSHAIGRMRAENLLRGGKPRSRPRLGQSYLLDLEVLESRRLLSGTWTTLSNAVPSSDGAQQGWVMTDGSIIVHGIDTGGAYYKLTPSDGSYASGTWSTLSTSNVDRLYTASEVLQSGKLLVIGGEYSGSTLAENFNRTGEIYNPVANTWTNITNFPNTQFGDDPSELLPNGTVLTGYISGPETYIYNPATNVWTEAGTKLRSDESDEEAWVTLPDHSILSYDVFSSASDGVGHAQRYVPSTNTWVDAGIVPVILSTASVGYELGPGLLLPDGRVLYTGGNNNTAYYTPSTNSWTAGPAMPNGYVMADAPGAVLPDGNVLLAMSPLGTIRNGSYTFPAPTYVYELNPTTNVYTNVTPSLGNFSMDEGSYATTFLVLPTGQVAMMNDSGTIALYTENGTPLSSAVPVISGITYSGTTGVYTLSGTNLNGINEGAAYGDDAEMSSNYPLVRVTATSGYITYARTTNWSLTGVDQGAETVTFTLPSGYTAGAYIVQAVANGVASSAVLAVLVNATTTPTVTLQTDSVNSGEMDVVGNGTIQERFLISSFSSIEIVGDNLADTLSVDVNSNLGSTPITIQAGSGDGTINVEQTSPDGLVAIAPSAGIDAVNVGTAGDGTALVQFLASQQIGLLTIGSGGMATVTGGTKKLLQTSGVITTGSGVLDLEDNDMIVHDGNLAALTAEIASGYNPAAGGNWSGAGIISSAAAADTTYLTTLGIILNDNAGSPVYGSFDGQSVGLTDVLVKYTYYGDANLDGKVDASDYSLIDNGCLLQLTGWFNGDFNYDGMIDGSDYTLIDNAFNMQGAVIAAQVAAPQAVAAQPAAVPKAVSLLTTTATEDAPVKSAKAALVFTAAPIGDASSLIDDWQSKRNGKGKAKFWLADE